MQGTERYKRNRKKKKNKKNIHHVCRWSTVNIHHWGFLPTDKHPSMGQIEHLTCMEWRPQVLTQLMKAWNDTKHKIFKPHRSSRGWTSCASPRSDLPEVEKYATESNSSENDLQGNQNQDIPNTEPVVIATNQPPKAKRTKWTKEEYKIVLQAFYKALSNPNTHTTQQL